MREGTSQRLDADIDTLIGGSKAPRTVETYSICFKRRPRIMELQNKSYIIDPQDDQQAAETDLLRYVALQFAPLQKIDSSFALYFVSIA